ncbi:MAG TPA: MarR family transcriptional regulator [Ilumatobacteraceae bacterium]|jgi:DNA-binding MarR family transcriptional regulator|nr:MarR family transcriptional regulator [Ilumatobacteraceae bacterium]
MATSIPAVPDLATPDLATEVADLLHHVNHSIRRQAIADADPNGVTSAQMRAMRTLIRREEPMRMSALAEALGIVRRSATSVVDDLEVMGLVERIADPSDRRAVGVQLTDAGRKAMADARRRRRTAAGQVLNSLGDADLLALRALLQRVDPC